MATTRVSPRTGWARRYRAALRAHLARGPGANLRPALGLGRRAVALGLETLDLARFHAQALTALLAPRVASGTRRRMIGQARRFFAETVVPIESTHLAALKARIRVRRLTKALRRRTADSSASSRELKRSIARRRMAEDALRESRRRHAALLAEAHRRQKQLRRLARKGLSRQEDERRKMSVQLYDEIAQTLLGINVRLLTVKRAAGVNTERIKKEIVDSQRPVRKSIERIARFSDEFVGTNSA